MCESCEKSCGKLTEKNISRIINICDKKGADIMGSNIFLEDIKEIQFEDYFKYDTNSRGSFFHTEQTPASRFLSSHILVTKPF